MPFYTFNELEDIQHHPGISTGHGPTAIGERIVFGRRYMEKGTGAKPHSHPNEQFLFVLKGCLRARIEGEDNEQILNPGHLMHVPPDVVHSMEVVGDGDVEYLNIKDAGVAG